MIFRHLSLVREGPLCIVRNGSLMFVSYCVGVGLALEVGFLDGWGCGSRVVAVRIACEYACGLAGPDIHHVGVGLLSYLRSQWRLVGRCFGPFAISRCEYSQQLDSIQGMHILGLA